MLLFTCGQGQPCSHTFSLYFSLAFHDHQLNYLHAQLVALELSFHLVRQLSTFAAKYSVPEEVVAVHISLGDDLFALLNLMGWKCGANEWQVSSLVAKRSLRTTGMTGAIDIPPVATCRYAKAYQTLSDGLGGELK